MEEKYCDLLIVRMDNDWIYIVEAPTSEAHKYDLVAFDTENGTKMGRVEDLMWCVIGNEVYRCVNLLAPICKANAIYHRSWNLEEESDQDK